MINSLQILGDAHVGHMDGWGGGWMWLTASGPRGNASSGSDHARTILAERYARG